MGHPGPFLWLAAAATLVSLTYSFPSDQESIAKLRSQLITKDDFMLSRQKKSGHFSSLIPPPLTITTQLHVSDDSLTNGDRGSHRRGRTWTDEDGATVIEGIRVPDDESDRVTWRNGRVINNVFVPNRPKKEPGQRAREAKGFDVIDSPRDYKYHAGATDSGRPVYYIVEEEPDDLHSDRSPYVYEPADTHTSLVSQVADYTQQGIGGQLQQQSSNDFVIKEHTYSMCPGCPSFSIPVPVPKAALVQEQQQQKYQYARNVTFLERVGNSVISTMQGWQNKALQLLDPVIKVKEKFFGGSGDGSVDQNTISEKYDSDTAGTTLVDNKSDGVDGQGNGSPSPLLLAGMAVAAMTLISSAVTLARVGSGSSSSNTQVNSRDFPDDSGNSRLKRYFEIGRALNWDEKCVEEEICRDIGLQQGPWGQALLEACANRKELEGCKSLQNEFRKRVNHRLS